MTQAELADRLQISAAYLSALEHGRRGAPGVGLVHQVCAEFGLIWDDADAMMALARMSHPRVVVDTSGLTPEQTALANRIAQLMPHLSPDLVTQLHAVLDKVNRQ